MARYVKNKTTREEFLFRKPLQTTITASDIFNLVKDFFIKNDLRLSLIASICTDGAPATLGNRSGFAAFLKKEVATINVTHCMTHRQALASELKALKEVFGTCVWIVNYIRKNYKSHRIFPFFCSTVGNKHNILLYHTDVRWFSRGRAMTRFLKLRYIQVVFTFTRPNF